MKRYLLATLLVSTLLIRENSAQGLQKDPDSLIVAAMAMIDQDSLRFYVQSLQDMGTRFMIAPNRKEVATWIMDKYNSFGIDEVRLDSFQSTVYINWPPLNYDTTLWQYNVEARIAGTAYAAQEVVLIGHYDNIVQDNDPMIFAPGADDNGSGTAATLECARVIMEMGYQPEQTIIFLSSAAEELLHYGDAGTEHYAMEAYEAGRDIVMAINNDMIAWNDGTWTISLFNHIYSTDITALAFDIINNYTTLGIDSWEPSHEVGGDIQPFLDVGYPGIYFMEHLINPNYHTVNDLIDALDFDYFAETTRISLGMILHSDLTIGCSEDYSALMTLELFPNPTTDLIRIQLPEGLDSGMLKLAEMDGREVLRGEVNRGDCTADVSSLASGIYLVVLESKKYPLKAKLVVY